MGNTGRLSFHGDTRQSVGAIGIAVALTLKAGPNPNPAYPTNPTVTTS